MNPVIADIEAFSKLVYSCFMTETSQTSNRYMQIFLGIIVLIMVLAILKASKDVSIPLVLSFFTFLILSPIVRKMDKLHIPQFFSITLVMALLLFIFVALGWFVVITIDTLVKVVPFYADKITSLDGLLSTRLSGILNLPEGTSFLSALPVNWSNLAINSLTSISGRFLSITKVALLVYIFILFLLLERRSFVPKLLAAIPRNKGMKMAVMFERITRQVSKYLLLKSLLSALTGIMFFITAIVTGLDFPLLWGVLAFIFNFIPSIGSIIITSVTILMGIIQFAPDWSQVVYIAILTISIQTILGNIIDPRLQGGQLNISPFVILVSLSLWGYIWGIPGMFISVPLTSVLQILCANIKTLRPAAVLMSSGKSYQREKEKQTAVSRYLRKQDKCKRGENPTLEAMEKAADTEAKRNNQKGDFIMPESFTEKR
ncbi:putative permease [Sphaerochaeta pleomorpha str. Grapes]|uniref:Putative permease n=1 Tax=Sphaerochaeta pleomorpha (strain ATCC BAA-1885 / DSM 22778 / Grapes) TaxID=158190 RepID=G8QSK2_SPHPG|nr:AI-2E family transporter [Sphaerochaeta pleomorpha]AEV28963.1 putative permease [Sphaerochaeta pleomorpha str. Grapes]